MPALESQGRRIRLAYVLAYSQASPVPFQMFR